MKKTALLFLLIIINHSTSSMDKDSGQKPIKTLSSSAMRNKMHRKYILATPYESKEVSNILFYGATVTTGSALLCMGCALQCPLMTSTGFALLISGAQEWEEYDLYKRNHYTSK